MASKNSKKSRIKPLKIDDIDDSEEDAPRAIPKSELTAAELEKLYDDSSGRILQERNDFFLPQIRDFVQKKAVG